MQLLLNISTKGERKHMKLLIEGNINNIYNCFDCLVVLAADYFNRSYELMSINTWGFSYKNYSYDFYLGRNISISADTNYKYLKDYHGINIIRNDTNDQVEAIKYIREEIKSHRPVIIHNDPFWDSQNKMYYQWVHLDHYSLVYGIDDNNNLYIYDRITKNRETVLLYGDFLKNKSIYFSFVLSQDKLNNYSYKDLLLKSIQYISYNDIKRFAEDVNKMFINPICENELRMEKIFDYPVIETTEKIRRLHLQYASALKYIEKHYYITGLSKVVANIEQIGSLWSAVMGMAVKCIYMNCDIKMLSKISCKLYDIAGLEETAYHDIVKICNNTFTYEHTESKSFQIANSKYTYIQLKHYFNNIGIGYSLDKDCCAELSKNGKYILVTHKYDSKLCVGNITFIFDNIQVETKDNLTCEGQKVICNNIGIQDSITFLGCSEYGNHKDSVTINFDDGTFEIIPLEMTNWCEKEAKFGEFITIIGTYAIRYNGQIFASDQDVYLFAKSYHIKSRQKVDEIELPYCPNIHLFGITFGRE